MESFGPVGTAAREDAYLVLPLADHQPVAVELELREPVIARPEAGRPSSEYTARSRLGLGAIERNCYANAYERYRAGRTESESYEVFFEARAAGFISVSQERMSSLPYFRAVSLTPFKVTPKAMYHA